MNRNRLIEKIFPTVGSFSWKTTTEPETETEPTKEEKLEKENAQLAKEVEDLKAKVSELEAKVEKLEAANKAHVATIEQLEIDKKALEEENEKLGAQAATEGAATQASGDNANQDPGRQTKLTSFDLIAREKWEKMHKED